MMAHHGFDFTFTCSVFNPDIGVTRCDFLPPSLAVTGAVAIVLFGFLGNGTWFKWFFGVWDDCSLASSGTELFSFGCFRFLAFSLVYTNTTEPGLSIEQ